MKAAACALVGVLLLSIACCLVDTKHVELEGLDLNDELVVDTRASPSASKPQQSEQCLGQECQQQKTEASEPKPRAAVGGGSRRLVTAASTSGPQRPKKYYAEAALAIVGVLYLIVGIWGTRVNSKIAEGFARTHCMGDSAIFPRQFSLCGAGDANALGFRSPLIKDSVSTFKFYASGRRHCQGCLATLKLRQRADLMAWPISLFMPSEDLVEIDVYMNEANMPLTVFAVGTPRQIKTLSDRPDVYAFAKAVKIPSSGLPTDPLSNWPTSKVQVLAEHSSIFYDIFSDPRVLPVFTSVAHADKLRLFRSVLVTSENSAGSHKRLLRFVFALPEADDMAALGPLLALVPLLIDLVGITKLSPEVKKKAVDARARQEAASADAEENRRKRIEALQKRKLEKLQEEKTRLARLDPEARRKAEEKLAKQASKKSMKVKMVRM